MLVTIVAHPNSRRPRVETDVDGKLHIYVNPPPLKGKANEVITKVLADHFKTKTLYVTLVRGNKSKIKVFRIDVEM